MAIEKIFWRAGLAGTCLMLLVACAAERGENKRFEAECKSAGHAADSAALADCVERKWSQYRYRPTHGGR